MLTDITPLDNLETEAKGIDSYMNVTCSEDPNEAVARGNDLTVYLARTGKMLADAKYHQDIAINENTILVTETYKSMPPSTKNKLIEAMCQRENHLVNWLERLNRACTHQLDWLRTVISKAKEEMRFQNGPY